MEFEVVPFSPSHLDIVDEANAQSIEPSPFLTSAYLQVWESCFAWEREKLTVVGRRGSEVVGVGIFYRSHYPDAFFLLGGKSLSDRLGFAVRAGLEREFVESYLSWHRKKSPFSCPLVINNLNCESPQCEAFLEYSKEKDFISVEETDVSPYVVLPPSFEDYLGSLKGKQRHELRRKMRRCEEILKGVSLEEAASESPDTLAEDFNDFVRLHSLSNQRKANFWKGRRRDFFAKIVEKFQANGWLRLFFLRRETTGERVAALLVFDYNGDYLLYNSGFNPLWKKASPGLTLVAMTIRRAILEGKRKYDFLRGDEKYKFDLGGHPRGIFRVEISP